MRFLSAAVLCLALAACGSDENADAGNNQAAGPAENAAAAPGSAADPMPRVLAAMEGLLVDPSAALYSNLRPGSVGSICGAIAVPLPNGTRAPPVPFVVSPEGIALVSATPHLAWDMPEDPFPTAYARWCATPRELEEMQAAIAASPARPPPDQSLPGDPLPGGNMVEPAPQPPLQPPPQPEPRATRPPARPEPPSDPNDVSFTNAVRRPDQ